jgi:chromosome segregation ATPase
MFSTLVIVVLVVWFTYRQTRILKEQKEITETLSSITRLQREVNKELYEYRIDIDTWKNDIVIKLTDIVEQQNEHHNDIIKEEQEITRLINSINRQQRDIVKEQNNIAKEINTMLNHNKN